MFSLENLLFNQVSLANEQLRIAIAFFGLLLTSYFDVFSRRNVPESLLYVFLFASIAVNFISYNEDIFLFSLAVALTIALFGYASYRLGQIGLADVLVMLSINFALPLHPSLSALSFNFPLIAGVFVFSGILFALYFLVSFSVRIYRTSARPDMLSFAILIPYIALAYVYINSPLYSPVYFSFITIMVFATMFFFAYRNDIYKMQAEKVPLSRLDAEEVVAIELIDPALVKKYRLQRLVTKDELERLRKLAVKEKQLRELWIYTKLPPFLPFMLAGLLVALLFSKYLLLFQ